jgi:Flp pilus assembly protein TadG
MRSRDRERGQSLVEFSFALIPFLFLLMGVVDLGRGIYMNNGVSQAAREIARVVSVHPCTGACTSGTWSAEAQAVINTQKSLVPGLIDSGIVVDCVDITNATVPAGQEGCPPGDYVRATVSATYMRVTPLLPLPNPYGLSAIAHVQVP